MTRFEEPAVEGSDGDDHDRFGSNSFTFVVNARHPLVGSFPQRLPWLIAIVGVLLSIGAALLTLRLIQRRTHAEELAGSLEQIAEENRKLYSEQRSIAQTLQHALLPEALPKIHGVETGARYEAGWRASTSAGTGTT